MDAKERMAIPRQQQKELSVAERITNFDEVGSGFDDATAKLEAERCLQCKKPKCREGCPIHNDIPGFIEAIRQGNIEEAYWKDRETNSLPAICSRVCPHEFQCEGHCIRGKGKKGEPVAIGMLERYLVDWMVDNNKNMLQPCAMPKDKKVAIVGSGPAGMSVAYYLAHEGYHCTIFESLPVLGGMLTVGIPAYRLPRQIIEAEFEALKNCGVTIVNNIIIGKDKTLQDLKDEVGSLEPKKPTEDAKPPSGLVSFDEGNEKITTEEAVEAVTPGKRRRRWRRGRRRKRKNKGNEQQSPGDDSKPGPDSGSDG